MKKLLVVLLALALVLSVTGMALASVDGHDLVIKKCSPIQINKVKVKQKVTIDNMADAYSGDANSIGNIGITKIKDNDSSADSCAGCASNTAPISVSNTGTSAAVSGDATTNSTNTNEVGQSSCVTQSNSNTCTEVKCIEPQ